MQQTRSNHRRFALGYHKTLVPLLIIGLIGSCINLYESWENQNLYAASLLVFLFICVLWVAGVARVFALKAQDRAIRAEENLRYFALSGKLLPPTLRISQIIALRFASDEEYVALVEKTTRENWSPGEIKRSINTWKADLYRV